MEQNSQNRRSYSNERNTNQDQDRYNQGYGSYRNFDSDDSDYRNGNQFNRNSDYRNGRNYGQDFNRNNDVNDSGWNNWSDQSSSGKNYGRNDRNRDFNSDSRDYNRSSNRDFDNFGSSYGQGSYSGDNDRNSNSQNRFNRYGSDYSRSQDYGRFNQSQDYGRNNYSEDYGRNRNYDYNRNQQGNNDRDWWDRTKDEVSSWFGDDDARRRREQDDRSQQMQSHRGKGPKDYKRSSERIREDVSDRLSDSHDVDASDIDVRVDGNEVILSGQVNTRSEKRRAEDIAEGVSGVTNVQNHLRVGQQQSTSMQNSGSSSMSQQNTGTSLTGSTSGSTLGSTSGSTEDITTPIGSEADKNKVKPEKANLS